MSTISRIRVPWSGGRGGAGVSTFFAVDTALALAPLRAFFNAVKAFVPSPITWRFDGVGDIIVVEDGVLSGSWITSSEADVVATGSNANMADAVGAVVNWNTSAVLFGHRVKGRTFLVPGIKDMFDSGTLNDTVIPTIELAAQDMLDASSGNFVVWSRPFAGTPAWTDVHGRVHAAKAAHDGAVSPIDSATVPDFGAVLRSRRD